MDYELAWIDWFLCLEGNEVFVEVDTEYIRDSFNLTGLETSVKHFEKALGIILDEDIDVDESFNEEENSSSDYSLFASSSSIEDAPILYGLIHARYILTIKGMAAMLEKFSCYVFGLCPNVNCKGRPVLPIGLSDTLGVCKAKVFCPTCNEIYLPSVHRLAMLDGVFFGTSFPHLFFMYYKDLVPETPIRYHIPKLFGFNMWHGVRDFLRIQLGDEDEKKKSDLVRKLPACVPSIK
ncbi:casein kinase II subunit beta-like isoform X2 [Hylaeus volcanicus]|nr:casein kinase II subunit beta-like isoform X2 [Hylaeus volcanicus]